MARVLQTSSGMVNVVATPPLKYSSNVRRRSKIITLTSYRSKAAQQVGLGVVLEVAGAEEALLDDVVEGHLPDGDEDAPADGPLRTVVQPAEALLPHHADQAVHHVVVTGDRMGDFILDLIRVTSNLTFFSARAGS